MRGFLLLRLILRIAIAQIAPFICIDPAWIGTATTRIDPAQIDTATTAPPPIVTVWI